jgi:hypothetical protein
MRCGDLIGEWNGTGDFQLKVSVTKIEATLHTLVENSYPGTNRLKPRHE